jgi:putative phosphoribosyl transferase
MFKNRTAAGEALAGSLARYRGSAGVVLAVPRGGVPVAAPVARSLGWPLDLVMTKKIGHPSNPEYAIGAVSLDDRIVVPHDQVPGKYIEKETKRIRKRLRTLYRELMGDRPPEALSDKTVVVVDDGVATGNTLLSIVGMLRRQQPARIVIAAPVAAPEAVERLRAVVDDVIVLDVPDDFYAVGRAYEDFTQVEEDEVRRYLTAPRSTR